MLIVPPPYPHCVYLLSRSDHVIIYVGVTSNLFARLGGHYLKHWWPEVAHVQVESFEARGAAERRESYLIKLIDPVYNVAGTDAGAVRHLEEMRVAINVLRRGREMAVRAPQDALAVEDVHCFPSTGVSLREALSHLTTAERPLGISGLRDASQRPGFPAPIGARGRGKTATKLYDLDALRAWRRASSVM